METEVLDFSFIGTSSVRQYLLGVPQGLLKAAASAGVDWVLPEEVGHGLTSVAQEM